MKTIRTPFGTLRLAKPNKKQTIDINLQTDSLTRADIRRWRTAWQQAIDADNPNRARLLDIYRDTMADAHLTGCVAQRTDFVMARSFRLDNADGTQNTEAAEIFDQQWFKDLCKLILQSIYYGHSLIELGDITTNNNGTPIYENVRLIPRKHVIPEHNRIIRNLSDHWTAGIDYKQPELNQWLIEAGTPNDLGLLLKASIHTIAKRNMTAYWDTFGETFGMPMRVAKTDTRDPKLLNHIFELLKKAAGKQTIVTDHDTDIQLIENARGDAYNVYQQRIQLANSEISKLIIGQTMTIEDGSSLSQSTTHLQVFKNIVEKDADFLRDTINNQLLPRMQQHGFHTQGLRFNWDYSEDYTPEQQLNIETAIADRYQIPPTYFAEKYGIPVGEPISRFQLAAKNTQKPFFD